MIEVRFGHVSMEGSDAPEIGEGANIWPAVTLDRPSRSVGTSVPFRHGRSVLAFELLAFTENGSARVNIAGSALVSRP